MEIIGLIASLIFLFVISAWLATAIIDSFLLTGTLSKRDIVLFALGVLPTLYGWYIFFTIAVER